MFQLQVTDCCRRLCSGVRARPEKPPGYPYPAPAGLCPLPGPAGGLALTGPASFQPPGWLAWVVEQPCGSPGELSVTTLAQSFISVFQFLPRCSWGECGTPHTPRKKLDLRCEEIWAESEADPLGPSSSAWRGGRAKRVRADRQKAQSGRGDDDSRRGDATCFLVWPCPLNLTSCSCPTAWPGTTAGLPHPRGLLIPCCLYPEQPPSVSFCEMFSSLG